MKKENCKYYFESHIKSLMDWGIEKKELKQIKKHMETCNECQDNFLMFVDIIEEYLFETALGSSNSTLKDLRTHLSNFYNLYIDTKFGNIIKYLLIYKKYRNKVLDLLQFKTNRELYDFYEKKVIPAFDEQLYNYKAS